MPVEIHELQTTVHVVDSTALLSSDVIKHIVEAVRKAIDSQDRDDEARDSESDMRSVVEQQREPRGR